MPPARCDKMASTEVFIGMQFKLRDAFVWVSLFLCLFPAAALAQSATVPMVMLSDLHFDPFHDPAKVPLLVKSPVEAWQGILESPDSPTQAADFKSVQKACKAKDLTDAPWVLLSGALKAARAQTPDAKLVTVSGDLLVHDLDCRYRAALGLPKAAGDDQSVSTAFAEKTAVFVMHQVEQEFKAIPVYFALGNNDSRCNHNRLDIRDEFLKATGQAVIDGLAGVSAAERKQALDTYDGAGYYAVTMPGPMRHTRLLVVDDVYMMSKFETCEADDKDTKGATEQIAWLTKELDAAKLRGERVWVLGHVPPAANPRSSLAKKNDLCGPGEAEMFLSSDGLADTLATHAAVVKLAVFGHTHMDEFHLIGAVPMKVVPSVSAVDGNLPSFTVGKVAPATATLVDYTVFAASNTTGLATTWTKEYAFDETYHEPSFTTAPLADLIGRLRADTLGTGPESQSYQKFYFKGASESELAPYWPGYICSLDHTRAASFKACACGGK